MKYTESSITVNVPKYLIPTRKNAVFLNEHKKLDRDLHVLLINCLSWKNKSYLDLMSASGIRALRLAKETKAFDKIIINDVKKQAIQNAKKNAKLNKVKAEFYNKSSRKLLMELEESVDAIDIDPFGSPIYYIADALPRLKKNGIMSVTATDTGALSGTFPTTCIRRYHSKSYLSEFYYESGIRILAKAVIEQASPYDTALEPFFAHATRHYFRIYFRKQKGAKKADALVKKNKFISYCPKCLHREISNNSICPNCKNKTIIFGPLYTGDLFDKKLLKKMIKKSKEHSELLSKMLDEAGVDTPWFYTTDRIAKKYKVAEPRMKNLPCAKTHITPKGFKTKKQIKKLLGDYFTT